MKYQSFPHQLTSFLFGLLFLIINPIVLADETEEIIETMPSWSTTEIHFQYGNLDTPSFAGGGDADTIIVWRF
ncbi:MAG TPA: hypothetical protein EYQ50_03685 [Verrucomicrobiales bacterium]|nr:hypothetical protein [Verrucomicrobiales bacterium]HIL71896.1 hypothetical protein [Verrucomicrobiota bacterium]